VLFRFILERDEDHPYLYPQAPFDRQMQEAKLAVLTDILVQELDSPDSHPYWKILAHTWCALVREQRSSSSQAESTAEVDTDGVIGPLQVNHEDEFVGSTERITDVGTKQAHEVVSAKIPIPQPSSAPSEPDSRPEDRYLEELLHRLEDLCSRHPPTDGMDVLSRPVEFSAFDTEVEAVGPETFSFIHWSDESEETYCERQEALKASTTAKASAPHHTNSSE